VELKLDIEEKILEKLKEEISLWEAPLEN